MMKEGELCITICKGVAGASRCTECAMMMVEGFDIECQGCDVGCRGCTKCATTMVEGV
jgi:hypothetical protein